MQTAALPEPAEPIAPDVAAVALVDADTCAAIGGMSRSWWVAEVAAGRAPQPVIRGKRCTRWRRADVITYWAQMPRARAPRRDAEATA